MIETYIRFSFILFMSLSAIGLVGFIPLLVLQHFIHKKILDPIYFNRDHYSSYELQIFSTFPLLIIKTLGYVKAIVFPSTMRKKFKNNIISPKENPGIFILAWLTMLILIFGGLVLINTAVMAYFHYSSI